MPSTKSEEEEDVGSRGNAEEDDEDPASYLVGTIVKEDDLCAVDDGTERRAG